MPWRLVPKTPAELQRDLTPKLASVPKVSTPRLPSVPKHPAPPGKAPIGNKWKWED
jgi:hypothetical protein